MRPRRRRNLMGGAGNFAPFRLGVELRLLVTHLPSNWRAPALALAMDKMPRELCLSFGAESLNSDAGAKKIIRVLQTNLAPDASGAGFRDVIAFSVLHRARFSLDEFLSRFEMDRRRAEARLPNDGIFPDIVLSSLRPHHAGITPNQKSMILSSAGCDPSDSAAP